MDCQTIKAGTPCIFMKTSGCSFNGGSCHTVVEQCEGCKNIVELPSGKFCATFPDPASKWAYGLCNFATHAKKEVVADNHKINPLKASKRASGKK